MSESSNINKYVERHKRKLARIPEPKPWLTKEKTYVVVWLMHDNHILLLSRMQDLQQIWEPIVGTYYRSSVYEEKSELIPTALKAVQETVGIIIDLYGHICIQQYRNVYHFVVQKWQGEPHNMQPNIHPHMYWFSLNELPETLEKDYHEALQGMQKNGVYSIEHMAPYSYVFINSEDLRLQPLSIPAGFKVTYNQFYNMLDRGKPIILADRPEAHRWMYEYYHNRLLTLEYKSDGILIEIGWYPEANPQGSFGIEVVDLNSDKRWDNFLQFDSAEKEIILKKLYEYIVLTVDGTIRNYREPDT
jgi:hypothetical protein